MALRDILSSYRPFVEPRFETPGFNPEEEERRRRRPDRGAMMARDLRELMSGVDAGGDPSLAEDYRRWAESPDQKQPGWRLGAAIASSFLRPLRQAGVPEMLATSPEQRRWQHEGQVLSDRMGGARERELEAVKQRGVLGKEGASQLAKAYEISNTGGLMRDPVTGETVAKLGKDEALYRSGEDPWGPPMPLVQNTPPRQPTVMDRDQIVLREDDSFGVPPAPFSDAKGNVFAGEERPYASPVSEMEDDTKRFEAETEAESRRDYNSAMRDVAAIGAESREKAAAIGAEASKYVADVRGPSGRREGLTAAQRSSALTRQVKNLDDAYGRIMQRLRTAPGKNKPPLSQAFATDEGARTAVQAAIHDMRGVYDTARAMLERDGFEVGAEPDWEALDPSKLTAPGKLYGTNTAKDAAARFEESMASVHAQMIASLSGGGEASSDLATIGARLKAQHPGAYDDMSDEELGRLARERGIE